jgi:hypothetical protein
LEKAIKLLIIEDDEPVLANLCYFLTEKNMMLPQLLMVWKG